MHVHGRSRGRDRVGARILGRDGRARRRGWTGARVPRAELRCGRCPRRALRRHARRVGRRANADGCRDGPRRVQDPVSPHPRRVGRRRPRAVVRRGRRLATRARGGGGAPPPCISDKTERDPSRTRTRACGPTRTIRSTDPASIPRTEDSDETRLRATAMKASATATATPPPPRPSRPELHAPRPSSRPSARTAPAPPGASVVASDTGIPPSASPLHSDGPWARRVLRGASTSSDLRSRWTPSAAAPSPSSVFASRRVRTRGECETAGPPRRRVHTSPRR